MSKHTPGPWTKNEYGDIIAKGDKLLIVGVALPCGHHPDEGEAEANRDLLFAAPDLLAYAQMEMLGGGSDFAAYHAHILAHGWDGVEPIRAFHERFRRLAIAKAQGGAQ